MSQSNSTLQDRLIVGNAYVVWLINEKRITGTLLSVGDDYLEIGRESPGSLVPRSSVARIDPIPVHTENKSAEVNEATRAKSSPRPRGGWLDRRKRYAW